MSDFLGLILALGVICVGYWMQRRQCPKPVEMSDAWKRTVLPGHLKDERKRGARCS